MLEKTLIKSILKNGIMGILELFFGIKKNFLSETNLLNFL